MTRFKEALAYIHKVEDRNGSITKTSEDDPDLLAAQNLLTTEDPDKLDLRIKELIIAGYSRNQISYKLKVNPVRVTRVKRENHLEIKLIFRYKITKNNFIGYSSYFQGIGDLIGFYAQGNLKYTIQRAKAKGYKVELTSIYWKDLPDDCLYACRNQAVYVKHGLDSWLKFQAR